MHTHIILHYVIPYSDICIYMVLHRGTHIYIYRERERERERERYAYHNMI